MKLLFFNLCVSPHQMPYINALAHHPDVEYIAFVAPYIDIDERVDMGWNASENMTDKKVNFLIDPSDDNVAELLKSHEGNDTHCIFSGINAFKRVAEWLRLSVKYNVKRDVLTEPPMIYEKPLWMHAIRFALRDWRLSRHIDNVFVTGDRFVPYYQFWNKRWKVWPFMYCTDLKTVVPDAERPNDDKLHLLYVGELCHRKNVQVLIEALSKIKRCNDKVSLGIVGHGRDRWTLEDLARKKGVDIRFHGSQPMNKVADFMMKADVLVLPSRHDGWGAVVNEALSLGLFVICSDHVGARYLINKLAVWGGELGNYCGLPFRSDDAEDLKERIEICIEKKKYIRATIEERIKWSEQTISGNAVAQYFIDKLKG